MSRARACTGASAAALCLFAGQVLAEDAAAEKDSAPKAHPQERIEVSRPRDYDERRESTAAKIVVGRDEIDRYGDSTVADVLKRLPGVTVTADGGIAMRGLGGGYTQILLDGEPVPPGFTIESLSPDLIERIEIFRAPTAEHSTQAIAGTINIVLRKKVSHAKRSVKLTAETRHARPDVKIDGQLADRAGPLSYTVTGSVRHDETRNSSVVEQVGHDAAGNLDSIVVIRQPWSAHFEQASIAPRVDLTLAPEHTLAWESFAQMSNWRAHFVSPSTTFLGAPPERALNDTVYTVQTTQARSSLAWARALAAGAKIESKLSANWDHRHSEAQWDAYDDAGRFILDRGVHGLVTDAGFTWTGKYTAPFVTDHALAFGWDGESTRRAETRVQHDVTFNDTPPDNTDESYDARVRRLAVYAQDEWQFTPRASLYLGLRWEGLDTRDIGNVVSTVSNRSSVVSPIVQLLWQVPGTGKDQVRAALARTYKAPTTRQLIPRRYVADNNTSVSPDFQGNPELRPEIAWGLDAAYEHYFTGGGSASVSAYWRRIDDVIVQELFEQEGVWITRPSNDRRAVVRGIEMDTKFALRTFFPRAPAIQLHANATRNWSFVESIPGPNNRLEREVPFTANAGIDYDVGGAPWTLGGNFTFSSAGLVRTSLSQASYFSAQRNLDLYALRKLGRDTKLRFTASNLLAPPRLQVDSHFDADGRLDQTLTEESYRAFRVQLEMQF